MPLTIEQLEKTLKERLDSIEPDVEEKCLAKLREETKGMVDGLKKDWAEAQKERGFHSGAGALPVDKMYRMKDFMSLVKSDGYVPENEMLKTWEPSTVRALAGWAKAIHQYKNGIGSLDPAIVKALGESSGSTGGFLVPVEFRSELLRLVIEGQIVRPRATIIPMATDTIKIPRINDTTHASTIHGGIKGTWTAESAAISQAAPAFGQVELHAKKFADLIIAPNELVMDSPISIPALLGVLLREGLGFFEDNSAINGSGVGEMLGFLAASGCLIAVTRKTTSHVKYEDICDMYARMFPSSLSRAVWVCSPAVFPELAQMSVAVGTGGSAVWITNYTTAAGAPPMTIFGRPLIISEKIPTLASQGDICFVDFSYYLIGDRMQMELTSSKERYFDTDETAFRIIERLDGQPWINSALTPKNGGDTLSAFVALAA